MTTLTAIDSKDLPVVRTGIGHFFIPTARPVVPEGINAFVPAAARDHQSEILSVAAFVALWSFAATGCLLPWGGLSWIAALQNAVCLLVWIPLWFLGLVLCFAVPGALILPLLYRGLLATESARSLSVALACLIFSVIALFLARSPLPPFQVVGWIWLGALGIEMLLRFILLFTKIRL